ncbi:MAG: Ku protein, partial [Wenzhouxiangella sp.]
MPARAMWKGIIKVDKLAVPVKLYSAVQDRSVHFRMLHATDSEPVKQMMVNPETDDIVAYNQTRRAHRTEEGAY